MEQNPLKRPERVKQAVRMLYVMLAIEGLATLMDMWGTLLSPRASAHYKGDEVMVGLFASVFLLFACGLVGLLIHMIGKGKNWARIIYTFVFVIFASLCMLSIIQASTDRSLYAAFVFALIIIIHATALLLLFQKESSDWFR